MIIIKDLSWNNWFSYGEKNYIDFSEPVLQVTGKNGVGKTSIPIILQELYYGKNCKGKKKTSLANRYIADCVLKAESNFEDDSGNKYNISLIRKTTLKLILLKNGKDISSHTATNTYKSIEKIMGLDFKTFSQITYQSSTDGLDFLVSTDANRKKFLTSLFSLDKYTVIHDKIKIAYTRLSNNINIIESKINTIEKWLLKYANEDLTKINIIDIPEVSHDDISKASTLTSDLKNITSTNKKINTNNTYKELLAGIDTSAEKEEYFLNEVEKKELIDKRVLLREKIISNTTLITNDIKSISKVETLEDRCPLCLQNISQKSIDSIVDNLYISIDTMGKSIAYSKEDTIDIDNKLDVIKQMEDKVKSRNKKEEDILRLSNSIDSSLPSEVLDKEEIERELNILINSITILKNSIKVISNDNNKASAHNERVKVILEQLSGYKDDILKEKEQLLEFQDTLYSLDILKKAFSSSGLLSYKIDFLVKDLENEINYYLGEFSDGKFQLIFKLENEKLNVQIIDNGNTISIQEVSAGELARINASTLLAIRKLMSAISTTKVNVLFLDEILAVLDDEGRDSLIDVLHKEKDLNTVIVSHQWSHPLIPKVNIIKENKVSKIENY